MIFDVSSTGGTPWVCVLTMSLIPLLAYMTVSTGAAKVFGWFVNLVSSPTCSIFLVKFPSRQISFMADRGWKGCRYGLVRVDGDLYRLHRLPTRYKGSRFRSEFPPFQVSPRACRCLVRLDLVWWWVYFLCYISTSLMTGNYLSVIIFFSGWVVFRDTKHFDRATFITSTPSINRGRRTRY